MFVVTSWPHMHKAHVCSYARGQKEFDTPSCRARTGMDVQGPRFGMQMFPKESRTRTGMNVQSTRFGMQMFHKESSNTHRYECSKHAIRHANVPQGIEQGALHSNKVDRGENREQTRRAQTMGKGGGSSRRELPRKSRCMTKGNW